MADKLYDDHEPRCEYCAHMRREREVVFCARRRTEATKPCSSFAYDPLKRLPRQEARLPEYRPEDFGFADDETGEVGFWQTDEEGLI